MKYESLESDLLNKVDKHMNDAGFTKHPKSEPVGNFNTDEIISNLNKHFNETNKEISSVIKDLSSLNNKIKNNEILRFLERLDDNDNRIIQYLQMSIQKSPLQKLEPILPAVLTGFVTFLMKNKNNINTKELADEIKALLEKEKGA
jgi:predicted PurR-regulated permease PerM